jgi:hypothetical protein
MEFFCDVIHISHLTYVHSQSFLIVLFVTQSLGCVLDFFKKIHQCGCKDPNFATKRFMLSKEGNYFV